MFSLLWGFAAQAVTAEVCFLVAAAMLLLVAATAVLLPLRSKPPTADSTITALATGEPTLVFDPDPHDGPVVVSIAHRVQDGRDDELVTAMRPLEQSRRRTGASRWRLARSGEDARAYQEEFVFRSWGEYEDSRASRWTGSDRANLDAVLALTEGEAAETHLFPISHRAARRRAP